MCVYIFESYSCVIVLLWLVTVSQQSSNVLVIHSVHVASPLRNPMLMYYKPQVEWLIISCSIL